ncbi:MAG TPA: xanthine dehydrogenase family protein molybdopterin-binding subunit [Stellaceae bacterium]|nr:xanthine dehydrogenase family protein molybdopterin-binding subunit [Stellaceae bacterium]
MQEELHPKLVGARVKRVEDPRLLTGQGSFADDYRPAGLLHVALLRSAHAHARIAGIDATAAMAVPGVLGVFTGEDLADAARPMVAQSRMRDYRATAMPMLARERVRYVGEPIAAIVAHDRYLAEDAVRAIAVDYRPLPAENDPMRAAEPSAPALHEEAGGNLILAREFARGDVEAGMAGAHLRVRATFRFRRKAVVALENRCYLAEYHRGRRELTLYGATQVPGIVRDGLADLLDMPASHIRVLARDVGGGFGGKASIYPEEVLVAVLARRLGRPVKYNADRLEDLSSTTQAFDEIVEAELGVAADGAIAALAADITGDVGAYAIYPWTAALEPVQVASFLCGPYRVPHYRGRTRGVATPKAPMGPYRGVGRPVAAFVMERLVDMAACRLGLDPVAMRRRNFVRAEEFPYRSGSGIVWDGTGFAECLDAVCAALPYQALRRWQEEARAAGRLVGLGFASYAELTGIGSKIPAAPGMPVNTGTETATVRIDASGAVTAIFGVASHGQGLETTLAQIVADELGARFEDVRIAQGDTAGRAYMTGTYASRSAVLAGGAAKLACAALREKLLNAASHLLEAHAADLDIERGRVFVRGTDRGLSFRELARRVYVEFGRLPVELQQELEATRLYDPQWGTTSCATHAALVEIDRGTFGVRVLRYVVAEDCGRIVNPMIVEGQVHGGVAQGIGAALLEEVVYDGEGQLLTGSLMDYLVPSAAEIPPIEALHIEAQSPTTLGGFRGMGEGGTIGAPAAVANAVADALAPLGIEIAELPITPERIYRLTENVLR